MTVYETTNRPTQTNKTHLQVTLIAYEHKIHIMKFMKFYFTKYAGV